MLRSSSIDSSGVADVQLKIMCRFIRQNSCPVVCLFYNLALRRDMQLSASQSSLPSPTMKNALVGERVECYHLALIISRDAIYASIVIVTIPSSWRTLTVTSGDHLEKTPVFIVP